MWSRSDLRIFVGAVGILSAADTGARAADPAAAAVVPPAPSRLGQIPPECRFDAEKPSDDQRRLNELDFAVRALDDDADPAPVLKQLAALLERPCFRPLADIAPLPSFGSLRAFTRWWFAGGESWISSALEWRDDRVVVLPPDARKVLALDGNAKHPLAPLLCRLRDPHCGHETAGWLERADTLLPVAQEKSARGFASISGHSEKPAPAPAPCDPPSTEGTPDARYLAWRACVEKQRPLRQFMLPLGPFRAPVDGWLVLSGRRGHYQFSDELAAYDLATGAALRARRQGDLGIGRALDAAEVARRRTGQRPVTTDRGRVAVDALREAALTLLLWPEAQRDVAFTRTAVKVPMSVDLRAQTAGPVPTRPPSVEYSSSGDTSFAWTWVGTDGRARASGTFLTSSGLGRSRGYPGWLMSLAEATFERGCPPAKPPRAALGRAAPLAGVSPIDAAPEELDTTELALGNALVKAVDSPCRPDR